METASCSETSVAIYQLPWRHVLENAILYLQPYHNVKPRMILYNTLRVTQGVVLTIHPF
jgi:hypothetical protein